MFRRIVSILIGIMLLLIASAQNKRGYLHVTGSIKVEQGLVEGTSIQILRNGALLNNISVNRTGSFRVQLELDNTYSFVFTKEAYYSKTIEIDTHIPPDVCDGDCSFPPYKIAVLLYKKVPGVSQMNQDIPRISYNPQIDNFDADIVRESKSLKDEIPAIISTVNEQSRRYERETLKAKSDKYKSLMSMADRYAAENNYEKAMHTYRDALMIFPDRETPRQKVNQMYQLLISQQLTETLGYPDRSNLLKYINYGDIKVKEREYSEAKVAFEIAMRIEPGNDEIEQRYNKAVDEVRRNEELARTENEHFNIVYAARTKRYNELIEKGDSALREEQLATAREFYSQAVPQINESSYALLMVQKIDELMHDDDIAQKLAEKRREEERKRLQDARNKAYDAAIEEADRNFNMRHYRDAVENYELAISIKNYELYPQNQIRLIKRILAKLQLEGEKYNQLIRNADALMYDRKYKEARPLYVNAHSLIPDERYAQSKIDEIDQILSQGESYEQKRAHYDKIIAQADQMFEMQQYQQAIEKYQEALTVLPAEKYPNQQITKIRGILSREANEQAKASQQKTDYDRAIARADQAFNQKSYQSARSLYQQALQIIPGQDYPRLQILKIDALLAENQQEQSSASALDQINFSDLQNVSAELREQAYAEAMSLAESFMDTKEWGLSRFYFRRALALKPNDKPAAEKLNHVEKQIMGSDVDEAKFAEMVERADEAFATGDFGVARFYYLKAREIKPNDDYVAERIQVTLRMAESTASRTLNREYSDAMNRAGEAMEAKNYSVARFFYRRALSVKANDPVASEKLAEVEKIINNQK